MRDVDLTSVCGEVLKRIEEGAFLTVRAGDRVNTMTIGWATLGVAWKQPVMMVMVRDSRHTFGIMEEATDFTVSVPSRDMKEEIAYCGTASGRDVDKFSDCQLATANGRHVVSPIIQSPGIHFECKIVYRNAIDPTHLTRSYDYLYPEKDYHTLYFGEIVACYEIQV